MGSSQSSSRSNSPSTIGSVTTSSFNVCAGPRTRVKALAAKAFDEDAAAGQKSASSASALHKSSSSSASAVASAPNRPSRLASSTQRTVKSNPSDIRSRGANVPARPPRLDSSARSMAASKNDSFDSEDDEDSDSSDSSKRVRQQQGSHSHTRMPVLQSSASASSSSAYRGGSSLQRFSAANQREVEDSSSSSTSSSMLSKMSKTFAGGSASSSIDGKKKCASSSDKLEKPPPKPLANGSYPKGTCDKCDGPHLTDNCPVYKKKRDDHPDAWRNFGRKTPLEMGKGGGNLKLRSAKVIRQPGDGNCLFHSMAYGLGGTNAGTLRREIAAFIKANEDLEIADTPMRDWIKWDSQTSVSQYASRMAVSGWGGGIEMAACSHLKRVNVHVYERSTYGTYKRISCFDYDNGARATIHVLYCGGVHYDALVP